MRSVIWMMGLLVLIAIDEAGAQSRPGSWEIGTFNCFYCQLRIPQPDVSTLNEIKAVRADFDRRHSHDPRLRIAPGDVITMCSASVCAEYVVTVDGDGYKGRKREAQTPPPPPRAGGGGGGGSGGGGRGHGGVNLPGGCIGKCTGRVWIGSKQR